MTVQILFDNGCSTQICARWSKQLKMPFTTLEILQKYLEDHKSVDWMSKIEFAEDLLNRIVGAETPLAVVYGVWNQSGWDEDDEFFEYDIHNGKKVVKEIHRINLNWNWR